MSDYLCKNCDINNNGWCPKRKCQINKLKDLDFCEYKTNAAMEDSMIEREFMGDIDKFQSHIKPRTINIYQNDINAFFEKNPDAHTFMLKDANFIVALNSLLSGVTTEGLINLIYLLCQTNSTLTSQLLRQIQTSTSPYGVDSQHWKATSSGRYNDEGRV